MTENQYGLDDVIDAFGQTCAVWFLLTGTDLRYSCTILQADVTAQTLEYEMAHIEKDSLDDLPVGTVVKFACLLYTNLKHL